MSLNNYLEHSQNSTPTLIKLSSDSNNDEQTFKRDKKQIYCKLCKTNYGLKTEISTIKCHFEANYKAEYAHTLLQLSQTIDYYGVHDESKVKKLNGLFQNNLQPE
ncbi:6157_t:CDS:2 [Cetraspora pellucida]|uniref:6157_t:CDS:1 n=1 Tax=Cetraspora pellucida TaxID=1433469 RepID=A0A9N9EFD1_9GLOM|nr:6157_t:CDS:2 [Cetraspora pellucida]